jgi:hypothetical protein
MVFIKSVYCECKVLILPESVPHQFIWTFILTYLCSKKYCMQFLVFIIAPFSLIISILPFRIFFGCQMAFISLFIYRLSEKSGKSKLSLHSPHLSDKERVVIEKNHHIIYVTCLWKWSKRWAYRQRNEQKICNHKYRVDKRIWTERKKHHAFSLPLCKLGVVNHS